MEANTSNTYDESFQSRAPAEPLTKLLGSVDKENFKSSSLKRVNPCLRVCGGALLRGRPGFSWVSIAESKDLLKEEGSRDPAHFRSYLSCFAV